MSNLVEKKTLDAFAEYADRHGIYDKFQFLISRVLLSKPADPFSFMIATLQRPASKLLRRDGQLIIKACAIAFHGTPSCGQSHIVPFLSFVFEILTR